jgi:AcrR family transcriptional regulator
MRDDEGQNKRELVFEAALRLFNREGFDNTPTALISKEAGVATGLLFHYFGTKEGLVNALYLRCKDSLIAALMAGYDPATPFEEGLRLLYGNYLAWTFNDSEEYLFFEQFGDSSHIGARTKETGHERCAPLYEILSEGMRRGIVRQVRVDYLFELLSSIMASTARYLIAHPARRKDQAFIDQSFAMIRDCLFA